MAASFGRTLKFAIPVLLFVTVAGFLLLGLFRDPQKIPSPLVGKTAPAFDLPRLGTGPADPGRLRSADLAGRPFVLNVWASWCAPCLQEHPLLIELAKRKVVPLVGMDYKDEPAQARAWLKRHGDPFDVIATDRDGRAAIEWGVYGVPETFVVDAAGVIRFKHIGPLTRDVMDRELLPLVQRLSSDRAP
jgi:cytochrome c biogenesis protein CcmG/thiol:disulfide interchange protein DsbE